MITCTLITDSRNRDNDIVFHLIVLQHTAGAEQNKFFGSHSNNFFKSSDTSRCADSGKVKSNVHVFVPNFINRYTTVCSI